MKRPGLTPLLLSATLFLASGFAAGPGAQETPRKISPPAAKSPAPAMGAPKRLTREEVLKRFDRNGDGRIDDDERAEAREQMMKENVDRQMSRAAASGGAEAFRALALELFDTNRDGQLDEEERAAARSFAEQNGIGGGGELRDELVKRFDRNGNGRIDDEERPALFEYLKERRAAMSAPAAAEPAMNAPAGREAEKKRLEAAAAEVAKRKQAQEKIKAAPAK